MTEFRLGEKVRATFEGEVSLATTPGDPYVRLEMPGDRQAFAWLPKAVVEPKDAEPEQFGPGDIVRDRNAPDYTYVIGHGGYVELGEGRWVPDQPGDTPWTSEHFEKLNLAEVPF